MQNIHADLDFNKLFIVEQPDQHGGLALFFMNEFQIDVLFLNNRMIDVKAVINGINIYMTFVHGDPVLERRDPVRNVLRISQQLKMDLGS